MSKIALTAMVVLGLAASIALAEPGHCPLPRFEDRYLGFAVGKPEGWSLDSIAGSITMRQDSRGETTAVVYPVRAAKSDAPEAALKAYVAKLKEAFRRVGGALEAIPATGGSLTLKGVYKGKDVSGELRARRQGEDLIVFGGWAARDAWRKVGPTALAVGQCYERRPARLLERRRQTGGGDMMGGATTTFGYALPEGWHVAGITFRGIDLDADGQAGVSFAYLTNAPGSMTVDQWIEQVAGMAGYTDRTLIAEQPLGRLTDSLGMRWDSQAKEYEWTFQGKRMHGVLTGAVSNPGYGAYSGMISVRYARAARWNEFSAITAVVQESIRILDAKPGQSLILPRNNPADSSSIMGSWERRNQAQDRASAHWQETIMGYQEARSPTTGQTYQAPLNSWNAAGPDGAGYYRAQPDGALERLELVNP